MHAMEKHATDLKRIETAINGHPSFSHSYVAELVGNHEIKIRSLSVGRQSSDKLEVSDNLDLNIQTLGNLGSEGRKLVAAEYFVNDDPGPGNGIPLTAIADSDAYRMHIDETVLALPQLRAGNHRVGVRVQNAAGIWGQPVFHTILAYSLFGDEDTAPPVIELTNGSISIPFQGSYTEPGFTAMDAVDGDLTSRVIVQGTINPDIPGVQYLVYNVTDTAGNAASVIRTVSVVDNQAPQVSGASSVVYNAPPATLDVFAGLSATDPEFGDLGYALQIKDSNINWFTAGDYSVTFEVEDPAGNVTEFIRSYTLSPEAIAYPSYQTWIDGRGDLLVRIVCLRQIRTETLSAIKTNGMQIRILLMSFHFLTMDAVRNGGVLSLQWSGLLRNQYWIEWTQNLTEWDFYTEKVNIEGGANFEIQVDLVSPEHPASFFRLVTEPRLPIEE